MTLSEETADELLSACRTAIGDELRSLTYFTPEEYEHVYLRSDLERDDVESPLSFVGVEREGFDAQRVFEWSELGDYRYNIRVFDEGYIVRVIVGDQGAYVTTDQLTMDLFEEVAQAVRSILAEDR